MQFTNTGRYFFAVVLIGLGILGMIKDQFAPGFQPVPESIQGQATLAYLTAAICIGVGAGLLFRSTAAFASRLLFGWLLVWLLILRLPWMVLSFGVGTWWAASSTAIMTATAGLLFSSLASEWDRAKLGFVVGGPGIRFARTLFGLGLIPIGLAHFLYLDATAPLVPAWMQWPVFWAYFTGAAFIATGLAVIANILARFAAMLVTVEIALLTITIWVPMVPTGSPSAFQWNEFVVSILLTACAWVLTDSYGRTGRRHE
jgi:uncharacterized membrane protein